MNTNPMGDWGAAAAKYNAPKPAAKPAVMPRPASTPAVKPAVKPTVAAPKPAPVAAKPAVMPAPTGLAALAALPPGVAQGLKAAREEAERQVAALNYRAIASGDPSTNWSQAKNDRLIEQLISGQTSPEKLEQALVSRGVKMTGNQPTAPPPIAMTPTRPSTKPGQATTPAAPGAQPLTPTPDLSADPSYLAYERMLASQQSDLEAQAAKSGDAVSRRLAFQLPQFDWQAQGQQRDLSFSDEDRGILRSGQHERQMAEMLRGQTAQRGALELDASEQRSGIESELARQIADIARRRQEQQINAADRRYRDQGLAPYRVG